ncbi:MAG: LemA family protein [Vicinamibacterales bacterium]
MQRVFEFISGLIQFAIFVAIVLALIAAWGYNSLRKLAEDVKEAQSNVDIALRKKISLINRLSEVAHQYGERESLVMLKVSQDVSEAAIRQTYQQSGTILSNIHGIAQRFPDLKASEQFRELAPAIDRAETDLQNWRVRCNAAIKSYNNGRNSLPHALYADFLGFRAARYLELESTESVDARIEKPVIADDGERLNALLGIAGSRMADATRALTGQGKLMAERAATRFQGDNSPARPSTHAVVECHYLDADKRPRGPVSRADLDQLFQAGAISPDTDILVPGAKGWTKYGQLDAPDIVP